MMKYCVEQRKGQLNGQLNSQLNDQLNGHFKTTFSMTNNSKGSEGITKVIFKRNFLATNIYLHTCSKNNK